MIDTNANNINKGITTLFTDGTFKIINLPVKIQEDMIKKGEQDIVISPYKKEDKICSTSTLNKLIQNEIFKDIPNSNPFSPFRIGDTIIMTRTNYKVGYINGETGTIIKRYPNNALEVAFEDKCLTIKNEEDMELAYAVTVHKAQGSEWDDVTICIPEFSKFITRRMLYTALTRTKKSVKIYSSKTVLKQIIENNPEEVRNTFLSEKPRII
jgi:exodeoxyribonuclease V alpha subunit